MTYPVLIQVMGQVVLISLSFGCEIATFRILCIPTEYPKKAALYKERRILAHDLRLPCNS